MPRMLEQQDKPRVAAEKREQGKGRRKNLER